MKTKSTPLTYFITLFFGAVFFYIAYRFSTAKNKKEEEKGAISLLIYLFIGGPIIGSLIANSMQKVDTNIVLK